ncbi:MAG TPA: NAD(P)H-dependent oxidoreductase [Candidatus Eisenbacteria bacterium]|nr:NAD(P)H-dependent oxidoreductase [Candidatus Eisenbacteria bacterium]
MNDGTLHVLAMAGSLRRASFNRGLVRAARDLAMPGIDLEIFDLAPLPLFNEDVRAAGPPDSVRLLKAAVARADALLIATPEYNYSVPGVLKNAIDWASRPPNDTPLPGKPAAIVGASNGGFGTVRSQLHLRQVLQGVGVLCMSRPELMVSQADTKFDADGNLTDDAVRQSLRKVLEGLAAWTRRLARSTSPA